ncbi:segregation/condensation protein A [Candidatus Woesearchaeota archaeon]|nr:segregation/condensation protein A [Candidatus Woesearchaeota archaeon]
MEEQIYKMLLEEKEITWQSIIYNLIKKDQIDPWNINISLLASKYREKITELQEHSFFISGKVLLASALLLRLKSHKFLTEHIPNFDNFLYPPEEPELSELLDEVQENNIYKDQKIPDLMIKTPAERKRKITIKELMKALEQALDIDYKREIKKRDYAVFRNAELPKNIIDISEVIKSIYNKIISFFKRNEEVTFTKLIPSEKKEDKLYTFLPLIFLESEGKIQLEQEIPFGEIKIKTPSKILRKF